METTTMYAHCTCASTANWVFVSQTRLTQIQFVLVDVSLEVMYAARYYRSSQLLNLTDFSGSYPYQPSFGFDTTHGSTWYTGAYVRATGKCHSLSCVCVSAMTGQGFAPYKRYF